MKLQYRFSTSNHGNMSFKYGSKKDVYSNRIKFIEDQGLKYTDVYGVGLDHGSRLIEASESKTLSQDSDANLETADGLYTRQKNTPLMILTADCAPVIIYNQAASFLAVLHCGWESLDKGLLENCFSLMQKIDKLVIADTKIIVGPHILRESYLVDRPKQKDSEKWQKSLVDLGYDTYSISLQKYIFERASEAGIEPSTIEQSHENTFDSNQYFSYRRSKETNTLQGRFATLAWIEK